MAKRRIPTRKGRARLPATHFDPAKFLEIAATGRVVSTHAKRRSCIVIAYDVDGTNWKLSIADNGVGRPDGTFAQSKTGLGTGIVMAFAQQLGARIETAGTTVSITHATFLTKENRAA